MKAFLTIALLATSAATLAAQIVTIQGSDLIKNSRTTLNNNFSFLNTLLGNGLAQFTGPSVTRSFALPDVAATIITSQNLGAGMAMAGSNLTFNTALLGTHTTIHNNENFCKSSNVSVVMACALPQLALAAYAEGQLFVMVSTTANPISVSIDGGAAVNLRAADGTTAAPLIGANVPFLGYYDSAVFRVLSWAGSLRQYIPIGAVPTITSGFGTTPSILGTDVGGRLTVGTGGSATTGVIAFGTAWPNAPTCIANDETTTLLVKATATTTALTLTSASAWAAADKLTWNCIGY